MNKNNNMSVKGSVGAPAKPVRLPKTPFTIESLASSNKNQCVLSLRKKINALFEAGSLVALKPKKQPKGAVGRPKAVFVTAENYDATKMVKATDVVPEAAKTTKTKKTGGKRGRPAKVKTPPATPEVVPTVPVTEPPTATPTPATVPTSENVVTVVEIAPQTPTETVVNETVSTTNVETPAETATIVPVVG
jgi:hypothetical protein